MADQIKSKKQLIPDLLDTYSEYSKLVGEIGLKMDELDRHHSRFHVAWGQLESEQEKDSKGPDPEPNHLVGRLETKARNHRVSLEAILHRLSGLVNTNREIADRVLGVQEKLESTIR